MMDRVCGMVVVVCQGAAGWAEQKVGQALMWQWLGAQKLDGQARWPPTPSKGGLTFNFPPGCL